MSFNRFLKILIILGDIFVNNGKQKWNQLHSAALDGDVTKIEAMLSLGFSVDLRDDTDRTPLMIAAYNDKLLAVNYLIKKGADPSLEDNDGWNALHFSSHGGNPDIIKLIFSCMPDIESKDGKGWTPLMVAVAASHGNLQAIRYLIEKGADPSLEDNCGWNSLHCAAQGGDPDAIELVLSHIPDIHSRTSKGWMPLMIAAGNGKLQAVKYLLDKDADPSLVDNNGWNSLHFASWGGNPHIVELMLGHGPSIDSRNFEGWTPLMIAADNGRQEAVNYLIGKGADPSLEDADGWNSLQCAARGGNPDVIEMLLSRMPADTGSRTVGGMTTLMIAADNGKLQAVKALIRKGADPSLEDNNGWNSLHFASRGGYPAVIKLILTHMPADVESRTADGKTPLMIAVLYGPLQAVKYLLERGADAFLEDNNGCNSLHHASCDPDIMELLPIYMPNGKSTTGNDKLRLVR